jgi:hypothetical protein
VQWFDASQVLNGKHRTGVYSLTKSLNTSEGAKVGGKEKAVRETLADGFR